MSQDNPENPAIETSQTSEQPSEQSQDQPSEQSQEQPSEQAQDQPPCSSEQYPAFQPQFQESLPQPEARLPIEQPQQQSQLQSSQQPFSTPPYLYGGIPWTSPLPQTSLGERPCKHHVPCAPKSFEQKHQFHTSPYLQHDSNLHDLFNRMMFSDRYCTLGRTGIKISRIILGTMNFDANNASQIDRVTLNEEQAHGILDKYVEMGGNCIDTASFFPWFGTSGACGESERMVGSWLAKKDRERMILITKIKVPNKDHNSSFGLSRTFLLNSVDRSLKNLNTKYLDVLLVNGFDYLTSVAETVRMLDELVVSGRVRHVGFCDMKAWQVQKFNDYARLMNKHLYACFEGEFNLLTRGLEMEMVDVCITEKLGFLAYSPFKYGFLTDAFEKGLLERESRFSKQTREKEAKKRRSPKKAAKQNAPLEENAEDAMDVSQPPEGEAEALSAPQEPIKESDSQTQLKESESQAKLKESESQSQLKENASQSQMNDAESSSRVRTDKSTEDEAEAAETSSSGTSSSEEEEESHENLSTFFQESFRFISSSPFFQELMTSCRRIAQQKSLTTAQIALRWVLQQNFVSSVVVGVDSIAELNECMACLSRDSELTLEELHELNTISMTPMPYPYNSQENQIGCQLLMTPPGLAAFEQIAQYSHNISQLYSQMEEETLFPQQHEQPQWMQQQKPPYESQHMPFQKWQRSTLARDDVKQEFNKPEQEMKESTEKSIE